MGNKERGLERRQTRMPQRADSAESRRNPTNWAHITRERVLQVLDEIICPEGAEYEEWLAATTFVRSALKQLNIDIHMKKRGKKRILELSLTRAFKSQDEHAETHNSEDIIVQAIREEILTRLWIQIHLGHHPQVRKGLDERLRENDDRFSMTDLKRDKRTNSLQHTIINVVISKLRNLESRKRAYQFIVNFLAGCLGRPIKLFDARTPEDHSKDIEGTPEVAKTPMIHYDLSRKKGAAVTDDDIAADSSGGDDFDKPPLSAAGRRGPARRTTQKTQRTKELEDPFASFRSWPKPARSPKVEAEIREAENIAAWVDEMMIKATGRTGRRK